MKDIELGKSSIVRIQKTEYRGKQYLDIRKFYSDENEEWQPTKKGIALPVDTAEEVLNTALKVLTE